MLTSEIIKAYLDKVVDSIKADAVAKGQKIPQYFRVEVDEEGGRLWAADYFKYLVLGRGPGKFPPPDKMLDFVHKNPDILAEARTRFKNISEKSLAFLIGRKIAKKGTDIFLGKKPGINMLGAMEDNMTVLLQILIRNEAVKITTNLVNTVR